MIIVEPTDYQRKKARKEAREMGVLHGSLTRGRGNQVGCMGEILVHAHVGGKRVGSSEYAYDIIAPCGTTIDVKTTKASGPPLPHYVARIYCAEDKREKYASKCDVYYFVRCNGGLKLATVIGWLPAREFFDMAVFTPKGSCNGDDSRLAFADEFTVPVSELRSPHTPFS